MHLVVSNKWPKFSNSKWKDIKQTVCVLDMAIWTGAYELKTKFEVNFKHWVNGGAKCRTTKIWLLRNDPQKGELNMIAESCQEHQKNWHMKLPKLLWQSTIFVTREITMLITKCVLFQVSKALLKIKVVFHYKVTNDKWSSTTRTKYAFQSRPFH